MKTRIIPFLFLLLSFDCHSAVKPPQNNKKAKSTAKTDTTKNAEYLDWDSVKLNGTISMISNYKDVVSKLGKPDSVGELDSGVNGSFYHKKFQECYLKELNFEKYNDTLVFSTIDFKKRSHFYLSNGKIRFNNKTTDLDFKKLFPSSFKNNRIHSTSMDKYEFIGLDVSRNKQDDDWVFLFDAQTGKLLSIEHDDAP